MPSDVTNEDALKSLIREAHECIKDLRKVIKEARQLHEADREDLIRCGVEAVNANIKRVGELVDESFADIQKDYKAWFDDLARDIKTDRMRVTHIALVRSNPDDESAIDNIGSPDRIAPLETGS